MKLFDLLTGGGIRALRHHKELIIGIQKRSAETQILRAREAGENEQGNDQQMGIGDGHNKAPRQSYPEEVSFHY